MSDTPRTPTGGGAVPPPPILSLSDGKPAQIPDAMARRIVSERMGSSAAAKDYGRNLSVAQVEIKDAKTGATRYQMVSRWNQPGGAHAEQLVLSEVETLKRSQKGAASIRVTHIYTERIPCGSHGCDWALKRYGISDSQTSYSVRVRDGQRAAKLESHYEPHRRLHLGATTGRAAARPAGGKPAEAPASPRGGAGKGTDNTAAAPAQRRAGKGSVQGVSATGTPGAAQTAPETRATSPEQRGTESRPASRAPQGKPVKARSQPKPAAPTDVTLRGRGTAATGTVSPDPAARTPAAAAQTPAPSRDTGWLKQGLVEVTVDKSNTARVSKFRPYKQAWKVSARTSASAARYGLPVIDALITLDGVMQEMKSFERQMRGAVSEAQKQVNSIYPEPKYLWERMFAGSDLDSDLRFPRAIDWLKAHTAENFDLLTADEIDEFVAWAEYYLAIVKDYDERGERLMQLATTLIAELTVLEPEFEKRHEALRAYERELWRKLETRAIHYLWIVAETVFMIYQEVGKVANQVSGIASAIGARRGEYEKLQDRLVRDLSAAAIELEEWPAQIRQAKAKIGLP